MYRSFKMAESGSEGWVKFFREAGIPPAIAADYAITFHDNRIQRNMLLDLNREILKEMGITLIGDVIAILRHAKSVHDKTARDRILAVQSSPRKGGSRGQKDNTEITTRNRKHSSKESAKHLRLEAAEDEIEMSPQKKQTVPSKRASIQEEEEDLSMEVDGIKVVTSTPTPAKKARMVLPEHEGGYRITMPSGSTPRSRAILSMIAARNKQRGTVFDRLGECIVSSTTGGGSPADDNMGASTTVITVTGVGSTPNKVEKSVFTRLGGKSSTPSSMGKIVSLIGGGRGSGTLSGQLEYAGILKNSSSPSRKCSVLLKQKKTGTMRADEETENAKDRLGLKQENQNDTTPVEPAVVRKILSTTGKKSAGIFTNPENAVNRSVKTRLGVTLASRESVKRPAVRQRITAPSNSPTTVTKITTPASGLRSTFIRNFRPRGGFQWRGGRFSAGLTARQGFRR